MAGAGLAGAIFYRVLQEPQPLGLSVHATQSTAQVRIAWDQRSRTVRKARAGYVEIVDGNQNVRVELDANELHIGYVNYQCQSRDVTVRLVVEAHDGRRAQELARFVGRPDQPIGEVARSEPSAGSGVGAAPADRTPGLEVPVPVESAEPASEQPNFPGPAVQPVQKMLVDQSVPGVATRGRARGKPHVYSGIEPPFVCSVGDVFRKTDAGPGWNTFTCLGKNVWSVTRTQDKR
jgi:hypothetical protein